MLKFHSLLLVLVTVIFPLSTSFAASYELFPAKILEITSDPQRPGMQLFITQPLNSKYPQSLSLSSTNLSEALSSNIAPGDSLIVESFLSNPNEKPTYTAVDYARNTQLYTLFGIFLVLAIWIGRKKGLMSIITMMISFWIMINFTIAQISQGRDPFFIAVISAFILVPINFFITHGFSKKTLSAAISTCFTLIVAISLAHIFVNWSRLTGLTSDETFWITQTFSQVTNFRGLVIASIVLGSIGILDDVTIAQSSTVDELIKTHQKYDAKKIYQQAMNIGRDHLASMVNTLILVYASSSLPLFVLFSQNIGDVSSLINLESITEEVIRSLVSSIALILAIPISTWLAVRMLRPQEKPLTPLKSE